MKISASTDGLQLQICTLNSNAIGDLNQISTLPLAHLLSLAEGCVANPSSSQSKLLEKLARLRERQIAEQFQLAVLGQFKRGKSTLLNALLRADVLPVGVVPVTAIPTFLQAGARPAVRVTYLGGQIEESQMNQLGALRARLISLVTEEHNPGNALGIARVNVRLPSQLLEPGVVLIDTPGVGSTLRHNTEAADAILPECDATLFVVSPDPPITQVEIEFLARIRKTAARFIIVLNKIDLLGTAERHTAATFLRRVLVEQVKLDAATPVFCISARKALHAIETDDAEEFKDSGMGELEAQLSKFLATEKRATLDAAVARKASTLLGELRLETEITLRALRLPLDDLERRMATFDEATQRFQTERQVAGDLVAGDRLRALKELEADAERLRISGREVLLSELGLALSRNGDPAAARETLSLAIVVFFDKALKNVVRDVGERLTAMFRVHQRRADELIALVRQTAADLMEIPFRTPRGEEAFEARRDPFWVTQPRAVTLNPIPPDAVDCFLPPSIRRKRSKERLLKEIDTILIRNVENLRWATIQNIEDAFRRFGMALDERLAISLAATRGAMKAALDQRTQHSGAIEAEISAGGSISAKLLTVERELARRSQPAELALQSV